MLLAELDPRGEQGDTAVGLSKGACQVLLGSAMELKKTWTNELVGRGYQDRLGRSRTSNCEFWLLSITRRKSSVVSWYTSSK